MDTLLLLFFFQIVYLMVKFGPIQHMFSLPTLKPTVNKLTKKQVKTYLIPIVGIFFILKDWYKSLED